VSDATVGTRAGIGAGALSPAALARLARPSGPALAPPRADDHTAVAAWRARVHDAWLAGDPPAAEAGHRTEAVGGVRCLRAGTPGPPPGQCLIVYLHGGGYALGSPEVAVPITARLATGFEVVSVDYRLAPEHPYPAALDDSMAVYRAVRAERPGAYVAMVGDSAGANLALCVALACRDRDEHAPDALALLSPHLDHADVATGRRDRRGPGEDVDEAAGVWLSQAYRAGRAADDPAVSPLRADLTGLPPTLVQVGSTEPLLAQSIRFARLARRAGVAVTLGVWEGLWHAWHYHRDLPEADQALAEVRDFVAELATPGV
jgi:epsilon-lactone hydrolase